MTTRLRTLFVSDPRFGAGLPAIRDLAKLLDSITAETVFVVGTILDRADAHGRARFPASDAEAWLRLLSLARSGTRVLLLPGTAEHWLGRYVGHGFCGMQICRNAEHEMQDGRRVFVTHGSEMDPAICAGTSLDARPALALPWLLATDARFTQLHKGLGRHFSPVADGVRRRLARARAYVYRFETLAARNAHDRGCDIAICGFVRQPAMRMRGDVLYANDGGWHANRVALAEDAGGNLLFLAHDATVPATYPLAHSTTLAA